MTKYVLLFMIVLAGIWYFNNAISSYQFPLENVLQHIVEEVKQEVNTPPPLRARIESPEALLTIEGVIQFTNIHRAKSGLPLLSENALLNTCALEKVKDMFEKQYFAHDSPEGVGASDLAKQAGCRFITIGENLALGNFLNDKALVEAWMDSPGDRENILNTHYTEIRIGVMKGIYEGKTTWMAVQHFGKPTSDCPPAPSGAMGHETDANKKRLDGLKEDLHRKKEELDELKRRNEAEEFNKNASEYNKLVEEYNNLVAEAKRMIKEYSYHNSFLNTLIYICNNDKRGRWESVRMRGFREVV